MADNRGDIVRILPGMNSNTRVAIVKRSDGFFALRPEQWRARVYEANLGIAPRWVPISGVASGIFASVELAEKEAVSEYPWIIAKDSN